MCYSHLLLTQLCPLGEGKKWLTSFPLPSLSFLCTVYDACLNGSHIHTCSTYTQMCVGIRRRRTYLHICSSFVFTHPVYECSQEKMERERENNTLRKEKEWLTVAEGEKKKKVLHSEAAVSSSSLFSSSPTRTSPNANWHRHFSTLLLFLFIHRKWRKNKHK